MDLSDLLLYRALRLALQVWRRGERRAVARLDLVRPRGLFQPFGETADDRYPAVFAFAARHLGERASEGATHRILSFGCSTGEEVFTLRRYCPGAAVIGLDISADRIATCRDRWARDGADPKIGFAVAANAKGQDTGAYDAIFAMAVFRHGRLGAFPEYCGPVIRFAAFEEISGDLARCLRPGGLLALRHANFRFSDTAAAAGFDTLLRLPASDKTPVYGRNDRLLPHDALEPVVFRKRG